MGFKLVCTNCRTSFSVGNDGLYIKNAAKCRTCSKPAHILHHKFKPPKKKAKKEWKLVGILIQNGFDFSSAYVPLIDDDNQFWGNLKVNCPDNLEDLKSFIHYARTMNSKIKK